MLLLSLEGVGSIRWGDLIRIAFRLHDDDDPINLFAQGALYPANTHVCIITFVNHSIGVRFDEERESERATQVNRFGSVIMLECALV